MRDGRNEPVFVVVLVVEPKPPKPLVGWVFCCWPKPPPPPPKKDMIGEIGAVSQRLRQARIVSRRRQKAIDDGSRRSRKEDLRAPSTRRGLMSWTLSLWVAMSRTRGGNEVWFMKLEKQPRVVG